MALFTWDELYERADGKAYGSPELRAKDTARWELSAIIKTETGVDIEECEIPEDAIDYFLEHQKVEYLFDEDGAFVEVR